jgi:hypothetical protein
VKIQKICLIIFCYTLWNDARAEEYVDASPVYMLPAQHKHPSCKGRLVTLQGFGTGESEILSLTNDVVVCCQKVCGEQGMASVGHSLPQYGTILKEMCHCQAKSFPSALVPDKSVDTPSQPLPAQNVQNDNLALPEEKEVSPSENSSAPPAEKEGAQTQSDFIDL